MIDGHAGPVANPEQALAQIGEAVKDLPAMDAGKALYTAATAYAKAGQWSLAREAYLLLLDKYPGHPLTIDAARWLVRYQASSEARRRYELSQFVELNEAAITWKDRAEKPPAIPKAKTKDWPPPESDIVQASTGSARRASVPPESGIERRWSWNRDSPLTATCSPTTSRPTCASRPPGDTSARPRGRSAGCCGTSPSQRSHWVARRALAAPIRGGNVSCSNRGC